MQSPGHIKNPLTIIAIFAGLSEISGTVVLPLIAAENQFYFMWFVMAFPMLLVGAFFCILLMNYRVLYAPSDFKNEDHFVALLPKASIYDQVKKLEEEAPHIAIDPTEGWNGEPPAIEEERQSEGILEPTASESPREHSAESAFSRFKTWARVRIASEIEDQVFDRLQKQYSQPISRGIASDRGIIDGAVQDGNKFVIFDVRTAESDMRGWEAYHIFDTMLERARSLTYPPSLDLVLILVLVIPGSASKEMPQVTNAAKDFERKFKIKTAVVTFQAPLLDR
ncbi:hypothetical protein JNB71_03370 [Rhizobium herbae]|uniref:Uncharacterized protein n=1 Tax=Rhizobium herbae TaxID=508661 RepID=A0ABS7H538_9HYPH|nr:hypothetical protein [Rhizobium herbae]MBW9062351.1 hypothetical protein [Rhizobium herbae]